MINRACNMKIFNDIIDSLALKFRESELARKLFKSSYHKLLALRKSNRRKKFHKHGLELIERFHQCMVDKNVPYTLAFGTLLGAVRDKTFIDHDLDIDVSIWYEDYSPELRIYLREYGFKLLYSYSVENDRVGKEETYIYKGVTIDIFYFYKEDVGLPYCCDFIHFPGTNSICYSIRKKGGLLPRKIYLPLCEERKLIDFHNIQLYVPANYEEILIFRYGSTYMVPDRNWSPVEHNPNIVEIEDSIGIMKGYK